MLRIKSRPYGLSHAPGAPCGEKHFNRLVDCCFQASRGAAPTIRYDSDSFQIAIDNCATSCFTNDMKGFVGTPEQVATKVVGIGQAVSTHIGTVRWLIVEDNGSRHELLIPGTRFQSSLPFRLLCPQHVAQVYKDPKTTCLTLMDKVVFVWGQGKWQPSPERPIAGSMICLLLASKRWLSMDFIRGIWPMSNHQCAQAVHMAKPQGNHGG
jgi:hypothetical protein